MHHPHHHHEAGGCDEYRTLDRRRFISMSSMGAMAAAMPAWLPEVRLASSQNSTRDIVVSVFMRGGADGLTLVAPYGDPLYYAGRPTIAVPRPDSSSPNRGTALTDFYMLPPGMMALMPAYRAGQLAIVQAAGQRYTTSRSHFEAEIYLENGKPDYAVETGWLGRHLATSEPIDPSAPLRAISVTGGSRRTLQGAPKTLPIPNPDNYQLGSPNELALQRLFASAWSPMRNAALDGLNTVNVMRGLDFQGYRPSNGAVYNGDSSFARSMRAIAVMIRGEIGLEAAHVDYGGWDTHAQQGSVGGVMANLMLEFSGALAAFWQDVMQGPQSLRVTLVVATEFGRNVRENGSTGTDHGRAGVMFVMGPAVRGGRIFGEWPGIAREQLEDGQDLRVTTDTRDILAELVQKRLGNTNQSLIFPNYVPRFRGVFG